MIQLKKLFLTALVILSIATTIFGFYSQEKTHAKEIEEFKDKKEEQIEKLKKEYDKELDLRDNIILDREGRVQELTQELLTYDSLIRINKKARNIWTQLNNSQDYVITAYDLSVQSCGKKFTDRSYGITRSGISLKGHDLRSASTISTDPSIIPLGSIVYIYFKKKEVQKYNGLYLAQDVGSAIKGNKIDLFFGDSNSEKPSRAALNFGIQKAKVIKVE